LTSRDGMRSGSCCQAVLPTALLIFSIASRNDRDCDGRSPRASISKIGSADSRNDLKRFSWISEGAAVDDQVERHRAAGRRNLHRPIVRLPLAWILAIEERRKEKQDAIRRPILWVELGYDNEIDVDVGIGAVGFVPVFRA